MKCDAIYFNSTALIIAGGEGDGGGGLVERKLNKSCITKNFRSLWHNRTKLNQNGNQQPVMTEGHSTEPFSESKRPPLNPILY